MGRPKQTSKSPGYPAALERRRNLGAAPAAEARITELHLLTRQLLRAHEETQQSVSGEIHDNIVQVLSAAIVRLSLLAQERVPPKVRRDLVELRSDLERTLAELRDLAKSMRPAPVGHLGLVAALQRIARDFRRRSGIKLHLETKSAPLRGLPEEQATGFLRIAQEALHNVEKHSRATEARVRLAASATEVRLEVTDNGCSFAPDEVRRAQARGRIGLFSIHERAALLGGEVHFDARPGRGTSVVVIAPARAVRAVKKTKCQRA